MKKNIILLFILLSGLAKVNAQLPEVSTASDPRWYYIHVLGEGERAGRVLTILDNDTKVYGRSVIFEKTKTATQLWRFEKNGNQYTIINKATNKQLDIVYSSSLSISHGTQSTTSSVTFSFEKQGDYFNIKSSKSASGGSSGNVYAHQASDYGNRNFVLQFEKSSYNNTPNSQFSFIKQEDMTNEEGILPKISTSENPVWYHIEVLGESERAGRVFTVQGNEVYGQAPSKSIKPADVDPQLWRFEKEGDEYIIINKAENKKLGTVYAGSPRNISILNVSDNPLGKWKLNRLSQYYYQIESTTPAKGGSSSNIYVHQSNYLEGVRNYVLMLENATWGYGVNSSFRFIEYEDPSVQLSTDEKTVWYYIKNKGTDYENNCITDVTAAGDTNIKFSIENIEAENPHQQWKIVKTNNDPADERIEFVNRATNKIIQTNSVQNGTFRYIQFTSDFSQSDGWKLNYIGQKQYIIAGKEKDNKIRYLYVGNSNALYPQIYTENNQNSCFTWEFVSASDLTGISPIIDNSEVKIYSSGRIVIVEGTEEYSIWNMQGIQMPKNRQLPVGIYIVKTGEKTVKLLIK